MEELFDRLVCDLYRTGRLTKDRDVLPDADVYAVLEAFMNKVQYAAEEPDALIVLDFIAGMTDNYVIKCLDQLFVPKGIT